jgi:hypothetical protein
MHINTRQLVQRKATGIPRPNAALSLTDVHESYHHKSISSDFVVNQQVTRQPAASFNYSGREEITLFTMITDGSAAVRPVILHLWKSSI